MYSKRIFLAGDSTVADYPENQSPMAGWGQLLPIFLADGYKIVNLASCGKSSKSFIEAGLLARIWEQIGAGDYLFIQFAHNDEKPNQTEPFTTFKFYLTQYVEGARQRGAFPVLVTPVQRRHFDGDGRLKQTHGDYPEAMRQLAVRLSVPLLDLMPRTEALYRSYGSEESKRLFVWLEAGEHPNYPEGSKDDTHFSEQGAQEVARLVADEIMRLGLPLAIG